MSKIGTIATVETTSKKAVGRRMTYVVYEAACGGIFTAKLIKVTDGRMEWRQVDMAHAEWSEPFATAKEAMNAAYRQWAAPFAAARKERESYLRSGGY